MNTVLAFYPFGIGIGFVMPLDLSFSVWFFFLGLVLGDFTMGSIWTLISIALGIRTYDFWP